MIRRWPMVTLWLVAAMACRPTNLTGARPPSPEVAGGGGVESAPPAAPPSPEGSPAQLRQVPSPDGAGDAGGPPPMLDAGSDGLGPPSDATPPLAVEPSDPDPKSETVTIRLLVEPQRKAEVFWGAKDLGLAPLDIVRPRDSGPLDLVLRAPGFLTFHTRAFTDRDDKLSIQLVPEREAARTFGYRAAASP